jgi:hypothetical protein
MDIKRRHILRNTAATAAAALGGIAPLDSETNVTLLKAFFDERHVIQTPCSPTLQMRRG